MNEVKHFEVKEYETNGISVLVQIDYDNEQIGLVEVEKGSMPRKYKAKQWVFANRKIEYMEGWQNILYAMKFAIEQAHKELKKVVDKRERVVEQKAVALQREISRNNRDIS